MLQKIKRRAAVFAVIALMAQFLILPVSVFAQDDTNAASGGGSATTGVPCKIDPNTGQKVGDCAVKPPQPPQPTIAAPVCTVDPATNKVPENCVKPPMPTQPGGTGPMIAPMINAPKPVPNKPMMQPMMKPTLSAPVNSANVIDVLSTDVQGTTTSGGMELTNTAATQVFKGWEDKGGQAGADDAMNFDKQTETQIMDLEKALTAAGDDQELKDMIMKKIMHLKDLRANLRAKTITQFGGETRDDMAPEKTNQPKLFEVRWGELNESIRRCNVEIPVPTTGTATASGGAAGGGAASTTNATDKCVIADVKYEGKIGVDSGMLAVRKPLLFEENEDKVTVEKGSTIAFTSVIHGHWDGLLVEFVPQNDSTEEGALKPVNVTISIGELSITKPASEIFGRYKIGNGHEIQIKPAFGGMSGMSAPQETKMIDAKASVETNVANVQDIAGQLKEKKLFGTKVNDLNNLTNDISQYNFEDETAAQMGAILKDAASQLSSTTNQDELVARIEELQKKLDELKKIARQKKFEKKMIPFKDTDDNEWYTNYVSDVKDKGIISGYKDKAGNELGEFRPANNITVAEILKIGLETADKGTEQGDPNLAGAKDHWAKGYVKQAEDMGLTLTDQNVDLNRPATRGEVIRLMLESFGIKPENVTKVDFSDVPASDPNAAYIEYAKKLGIISGDAGKNTFRPNDPVNRAEAAKITDETINVLTGE